MACVCAPSPGCRQRWRASAFTLFFLTAAAVLPAATPADAWRLLADSRPKDAWRILDDLPDSREVRLARALALTHLQPVAQTALQQAELILQDLSAGADEIAQEAEYLRARLHQIHYTPADPARAATLYAALAARYPDSRWGQLALVKLAMLHLYALPEPAEPEGRLARAEELLARIRIPDLQRDLHLQIALAGLFHRLAPARVLPHMLAADRIGGVPGVAQEDLVIQIGELSLRAGQLAQSREYFERYLREYAVNPRCYTVRQRLAKLAAQEAASATP